MRIRKFVARSMAEAMLAVRAELGDSAVLLKTRALDRRVDGRNGFEVTAAVEPEPLRTPALRRPREARPGPSPAALPPTGTELLAPQPGAAVDGAVSVSQAV